MLLLPDRARQQQVCDVDASHQQQAGNGHQENDQRLSVVPDQLFLEGCERRREGCLFIGRQIIADRVLQRVRSAVAAATDTPGSQPRQAQSNSGHPSLRPAAPLEKARGSRTQWASGRFVSPIVARFDGRHVERLRHDTDDRVRKAIQPNGLADDAGIAAELLAPQVMHQYHDVLVARLRFTHCEGSPQLRLDLEHGKDPGSGRQHTHLQRTSIGSERQQNLAASRRSSRSCDCAAARK